MAILILHLCVSLSLQPYLRSWSQDLNAPVLSVDYSLAPEAPFPRALEECFYAYCWAIKNHNLLGEGNSPVFILPDHIIPVIHICFLNLQWNESNNISFSPYCDEHQCVTAYWKIKIYWVGTSFCWILRCRCCTQKWRQMNVNLQGLSRLNYWRSLAYVIRRKSLEGPVMTFWLNIVWKIRNMTCSQ